MVDDGDFAFLDLTRIDPGDADRIRQIIAGVTHADDESGPSGWLEVGAAARTTYAERGAQVGPGFEKYLLIQIGDAGAHAADEGAPDEGLELMQFACAEVEARGWAQSDHAGFESYTTCKERVDVLLQPPPAESPR